MINADNGFHNCIQVVYWMGKSHIYCAKTIVFGKLIMIDYLKKLICTLSFETIWVDVSSPSVVSGVANSKGDEERVRGGGGGGGELGLEIWNAWG